MAGIYFKAVGADYKLVLDIVCNTGCLLMESQSQISRDLLEFNNSDDAYAHICANPRRSHFLRAWHPDMKGDVIVAKRPFHKDAAIDSRYVYVVEGWGLLNLHLERVQPDMMILHTSDIIHNSLKRASYWEESCKAQGAVASWNWDAVEKISRSIGYQIRKNSVKYENSGLLLPEAMRLWQSGCR